MESRKLETKWRESSSPPCDLLWIFMAGRSMQHETHCRQGLCLCLNTLSAGLQTDFARLPLAPYLPFHFVAPVTWQSDPSVTFV